MNGLVFSIVHFFLASELGLSVHVYVLGDKFLSLLLRLVGLLYLDVDVLVHI